MTQYEKYDIIEIDRNCINNAEYNPRKIKPEARKKLKENIEKVGLLSPIIWNENTGNIVGGHQRISILDSLNKNKDYKIKVAKVNLDEKTEKEQNIFLNNTSAQGEFDFALLQDMYNDGINFDNAGFDTKEVFKIFDENPEKLNDKDLQELSDKIRHNTALRDKVKKKSGEDKDTLFYCVLVFKNMYNKEEFLKQLGLNNDTIQNGEEIFDIINNQ